VCSSDLEVLGQAHLLGQGKALSQLLVRKRLHSMILWGSAGVGKTTLARLLAQSVSARWHALSAVQDGIKEIRQLLVQAQSEFDQGVQTVCFVDEIHRFNKGQQDALLPAIESGLITLIGATTENPSFALNNALLSRARVYVLKSLDADALFSLLERGLAQLSQDLGVVSLDLAEESLPWVLAWADGDGRKLINLLEQLSDFAEADVQGKAIISADSVRVVLAGGQSRRFDQEGELFYDLVSALHKSIRGSAVDASLYWFARLLDGGCDRLYIARRLIRIASEDIGNADPRALTLCVDAMKAYEVLGSPEGELALAQAVSYLATAPKSNAVYSAYKQVRQTVASMPTLDVPLSLRNAPTALMKSLGYGKGYRYAHDEPHAYSVGAQYFPDALHQQFPRYYHPVERGYEQTIAQRMAFWQDLAAQ
jgi:putative ATPase